MSVASCSSFYPIETLPPKRQRLTWTDEENAIILEEERRLGTQWDRIAAVLPGRTADAVRNQCHRLHKHAHLYTSILPSLDSSRDDSGDEEERKTGSAHGRTMWTNEEDRLICDGVRRFGCKWRQIAAMLPGRSDSSVRNRWSRIQETFGELGENDDERQTLPPSPSPSKPKPFKPFKASHASATGKRRRGDAGVPLAPSAGSGCLGSLPIATADCGDPLAASVSQTAMLYPHLFGHLHPDKSWPVYKSWPHANVMPLPQLSPLAAQQLAALQPPPLQLPPAAAAPEQAPPAVAPAAPEGAAAPSSELDDRTRSPSPPGAAPAGVFPAAEYPVDYGTAAGFGEHELPPPPAPPPAALPMARSRSAPVMLARTFGRGAVPASIEYAAGYAAGAAAAAGISPAQWVESVDDGSSLTEEEADAAAPCAPPPRAGGELVHEFDDVSLSHELSSSSPKSGHEEDEVVPLMGLFVDSLEDAPPDDAPVPRGAVSPSA